MNTLQDAPTTDTASTSEAGQTESYPSLLNTNWKWVALRAALALVFGVIALFSPLSAVYALTFVFGAYALLDGVTSIVMGVKNARNKVERWWSLVLRGVLGVFAGVAVVLVPWAAAVALVIFNWVMLSLWSISTGVMEVAAGRRLRQEQAKGSGWLMASGVISVVLGAAVPVVLIINPAASMVAMGLMMGVYALMAAGLLMGLALTLQRSAIRGRPDVCC